jgi:hypothetical protein
MQLLLELILDPPRAHCTIEQHQQNKTNHPKISTEERKLIVCRVKQMFIQLPKVTQK